MMRNTPNPWRGGGETWVPLHAKVTFFYATCGGLTFPQEQHDPSSTLSCCLVPNPRGRRLAEPIEDTHTTGRWVLPALIKARAM